MTATDTHQVLVIGAGVAGLTATAALAAAGLDVVCLEARDRVGGRLLSTHVEQGALDLGATWFWPGERRVHQLITRLGIPVFPQHSEGDGLYEDGSGVRRLGGNPIDVPAYRYGTGAQAMAEALAATLPAGTVRLSRPVMAIEGGTEGELTISDDDGSVVAEQVVLALPPALAVAGIRFEPLLPEALLRLARATPVWMGATAKTVVQYVHAFWREDGLAGAAVSAVGPLREIHDMSGRDGRPAALFAFTHASAGGDGVADQLAPGQVVDHLVRLFGRQAASPSRVLVQDWSRQPYTSPPNVGGRTGYGLFGHPAYAGAALGGRVHWASTETSALNPGHVEGALAAGERAAARVLTAIRRRRTGQTTTTAKDR